MCAQVGPNMRCMCVCVCVCVHRFYSEGVYYREDCYNDPDHLNHAVVLVGYGTTPSGECDTHIHTKTHTHIR